MLQPSGEAVEQISEEQLRHSYNLMRSKGYSDEDKFARDIELGIVDLSDEESEEDVSTERTEEETDSEAQKEEAGETVQETEEQATNQGGETEEVTTKESKVVEDKVDLQKYKTLEGILKARNQEFENLQHKFTEIEPYLRNLSDPKFQQHVLAYNPIGNQPIQEPHGFDKADEEYMTAGEFRRMLQQERKQAEIMQKVQKSTEFQQNFNRATSNNRNELISSGVDPNEVDLAMQEFQSAFMSGNVYKLAHRAHTYEKAIEEAEKRGREKALKEIKSGSAGAVPRTVKAQSTKVSKAEKEDWEDMGQAELKKFAESLDPSSPIFEKFGRWVEKKAAQKY
jgi:hypothetical protein